MTKKIWLKVTRDKYELPVAVADTARELAIITGADINTIRSGAFRDKKGEYNSVYKSIDIEDDDLT